MAKCGTCKRSEMGRLNICHAGHAVKYPLMVNEHDCLDHEYDPDGEKVRMTPFNHVEFEYCSECAHSIGVVCSGKSWIPFKEEPRCEFFRYKALTCKHAIPELQYGNGFRNNRCSLPPEKRQTEARQGWEWRCPNAHRFTSMKCYEAARVTHKYECGGCGEKHVE